MPKVSFISANGDVRVIAATVGDSVMQTAVRNGVPGIVGDCGGVLSCATCHVYVDDAYLSLLPAVTEAEDEMLDGTAEDRRPTSRLSCQIPVSEALGDIEVTMPEFQE